MVKMQVISVKSVSYTANDGKKAVSNRAFFLLDDGNIGYLKTPLEVKKGDVVDVDFITNSEMLIVPKIIGVSVK